MDLDDAPLPPRQRRRQRPDSVDDIEHIQALLHGAPGELGSVPSAAIPASNAPAAAAAGVGHRQSRARPPPAAVPPLAPPPANAGSSAPPDTSRFALPGPRSTATVLHCEACDCFVPVGAGSRAAATATAAATAASAAAASSSSSSSPSPPSSSLPDSWRDHVAGIRHSRAALGAAMSGGVPGAAVAVSVFEDEEVSLSQQQRQRQRRQQEREDFYQEQQRLRQEIDDSFQGLRTECLKELLRHSGVTDGGRELARRFSCPGLTQAFSELIQAMCDFNMQRWSARRGGGGFGVGGYGGGGVANLLGSIFGGGGSGGGGGGAWREELRVPMATPATVAVLAFLLRGGFLPENGWTGGETTGIGDGWLGKHQRAGGGGGGDGGGSDSGDDFVYDADGPRPPSPALFVSLAPVHERDLPAVTAACALLARSLADNDGLRELTIDGGRLPRVAAPPPSSSFSSSAAGGGSLVPRREEQRLWGLVAGELKRSLRCNDALEAVKLSLPRLSLGAEDACELAAAAAGAREARRRAFLSAAHPRCCIRGDGEEEGPLSTPLSMLPMDLMVVIAGMGIKRGPCRFELEEV